MLINRCNNYILFEATELLCELYLSDTNFPQLLERFDSHLQRSNARFQFLFSFPFFAINAAAKEKNIEKVKHFFSLSPFKLKRSDKWMSKVLGFDGFKNVIECIKENADNSLETSSILAGLNNLQLLWQQLLVSESKVTPQDFQALDNVLFNLSH